MKDQMLCDLETGICGPTGANTTPTGFVVLTTPKSNDIEVNQKEEQTPSVSNPFEKEA